MDISSNSSIQSDSLLLGNIRIEIVILTLAITSFYLDNDNNYGGGGNNEKTY